jgi:hypothetical protein
VYASALRAATLPFGNYGVSTPTNKNHGAEWVCREQMLLLPLLPQMLLTLEKLQQQWG